MSRDFKIQGYSAYEKGYHCQKLLEVFSTGLSNESFCKEVMVTPRTFQRWVATHEEFAEAYELGQALRTAHYHERLVDGMDSRDANVQAIIAAAKMVGRLTTNRPLRLRGLKKDASFKEQYECLLENVAMEELEGSEVKTFADLLAAGVKIDEATTQKERIDALEEHAGLV